MAVKTMFHEEARSAMARSDKKDRAKEEYNLHDEFMAVAEGMLSKSSKVYKQLKLAHVLDRME